MRHWLSAPRSERFPPRFICNPGQASSCGHRSCSEAFSINNTEKVSHYFSYHYSRQIFRLLVRTWFSELQPVVWFMQRVWSGHLMKGQHKCYGAEDVSQDGEKPAHWAVARVERKKRKLVWRFVTIRSLCFRKGVVGGEGLGAQQSSGMWGKTWVLGMFVPINRSDWLPVSVWEELLIILYQLHCYGCEINIDSVCLLH